MMLKQNNIQVECVILLKFLTAEDNIRGYKGEKAYRLLEEDGVVASESSSSWWRYSNW